MHIYKLSQSEFIRVNETRRDLKINFGDLTTVVCMFGENSSTEAAQQGREKGIDRKEGREGARMLLLRAMQQRCLRR